MGTCGSREKELRDKVQLNDLEFEKCMRAFNRMSAVPPGYFNDINIPYRRAKEFIRYEGFKKKFKDNLDLSYKLFRWFTSQSEHQQVDFPTFLVSDKIAELLAKQSTRMISQQQQLRQLDQAQLLLLISISNPHVYTRDQFRMETLKNIQIGYLVASTYFREVVTMQGQKTPLSSKDVEAVAMELLQQIFPDNRMSAIDLVTFFIKMKTIAPNIAKIVRQYFEGKLLNKAAKNKLPQLLQASNLFNNSHLALMQIATPWLNKVKKLSRVYQYLKGQVFNFNKMANSLLQCGCPTLIMISHRNVEDQEVRLFPTTTEQTTTCLWVSVRLVLAHSPRYNRGFTELHLYPFSYVQTLQTITNARLIQICSDQSDRYKTHIPDPIEQSSLFQKSWAWQ